MNSASFYQDLATAGQDPVDVARAALERGVPSRQVIRLVREVFGVSLVEAKDAYLQAQHGLTLHDDQGQLGDQFVMDALEFRLEEDPALFKLALHRGLGRALQHLQQVDPAPLRPLVQKALLHDSALSAQTEGRSVAYLLDAARLAGLEDLPGVLLAALDERLERRDTDSWDAPSCWGCSKRSPSKEMCR